ncbi:MAG TPA: c-type cytochrome [Usitatibacter sp.]|nr:c-type cytochrome [Usitatibacter sp.]
MPPFRLLAAVALSGAALSAPAAENTKVTLQNKIAQCQGCHGIEGWKTAYPEVYRVPKLGGQKAAYIVNALKEYKTGDRDFPTMHAMAADLSDEDMKQLAEYFAGQGGPQTAENQPAAGGK